jgi:hypothetical protein
MLTIIGIIAAALAVAFVWNYLDKAGLEYLDDIKQPEPPPASAPEPVKEVQSVIITDNSEVSDIKIELPPEPAPVVEEPAPVVEEPAPVVDEPVVQEVVETKPPVAKKPGRKPGRKPAAKK